MNMQLVWLWLWFFLGALLYMIKRAFYLITGSNPVANNVSQFIRVAGVPLLFRFAVDSGIYWACFSPEVLQKGLDYMGWGQASMMIAIITQFSVFAFFFGLGVDPIVDWAIPTVLGRLPGFKDFWPQMPPPMRDQPPPPAAG